MLKENDLCRNNDIVTIKLISGDELIGKLIDKSDAYIKVNTPLLMMIESQTNEIIDPITQQKRQNNQNMVVFYPFMLGLPNKETIVLEKSKIIVMARARDDAAVQYRKSINDLNDEGLTN